MPPSAPDRTVSAAGRNSRLARESCAMKNKLHESCQKNEPEKPAGFSGSFHLSLIFTESAPPEESFILLTDLPDQPELT